MIGMNRAQREMKFRQEDEGAGAGRGEMKRKNLKVVMRAS
jgi:hypothetical protein